MSLACTICERRLETPAMACTLCSNRMDASLVEVGHHHAELPEHLERIVGSSQRVTGSHEAPLPLRVDPLDLSLGAPTGRRRWTAITDPFGDQGGHQSVLTVLDTWVRDWRDQRSKGERLPIPAGPSMVSWLRIRLDWASAEHPAIDEFDTEIRDLRTNLRRALGLTGKPEFLDTPCRKCDWLALLHVPRQDRVECVHCGDLSTGDEFHRWSGLLAVGVWEGIVDIDLTKQLYVDEAALLVRVKATVIRQWATRGVLPVADREHGRPKFTIGAVFEAERRTRTGVLAV